jgi:hypothetical protein
MQDTKNVPNLISNSKKISTSLFVLIIICFFLPFVTISCGAPNQAGSMQVEMSGIEMATGKNVSSSSFPYAGYADSLAKAFSPNGSSSSSQPSSSNSFSVPSSTPAIVAFVAAIAGLISSLMNLRKRILLHTGLGVAGFISLLLLKSGTVEEVQKSSKALGYPAIGYPSFTPKFEIGFWLSLFLFLAVAFFNGWILYEKKSKVNGEQVNPSLDESNAV